MRVEAGAGKAAKNEQFVCAGLYRDGIHYLIALAIFVLVSNVAASFGVWVEFCCCYALNIFLTVAENFRLK